MSTIQELKDKALEVKNATRTAENTAMRVGGLFEDIVDYVAINAGPKGDKGDQGNPGPKGDKGEKGDPGESGASDRPYDPNPGHHGGKGVKILKLGDNYNNIITNLDFDSVNTIYIIRYDFDLNGWTINMPRDCVILFDGGSLSNGTIVYNKTVIEGFNDSYTNIHTQGRLDNETIVLEHYGNYPAEALTNLCTYLTPDEVQSPVISITRSITLEDDVLISNNTQAVMNHMISIVGTGKETYIYTNGHHFKGRNLLKEGDTTGIFDGFVRFQNLAFKGNGTQGEVNDNYAIDCDTLLRLYFDRCFISNLKVFLKANSPLGWMQTISLTDCYVRNVDLLIYSIYMTPDVKILNCVVEASANFVHCEGNTSGLLVEGCCIEGISKRPFYLGGHIQEVNIVNNYFEYNGIDFEGCQVDASAADSINLNFSGNIISPLYKPADASGPEINHRWKPAIKLTDNINSLARLDHVDNFGYDKHLLACNNSIGNSSIGGVLIETSYSFRRFLKAYSNANLAVKIVQPMINKTVYHRFTFSGVVGQSGFSNSLFFEENAYNITVVQGEHTASIVNMRALTAEEVAHLFILRQDAWSISLYCNDYALAQELAGTIVMVTMNYDIADYSNYISSLAIEDHTISGMPSPAVIYPSPMFNNVYQHVTLNGWGSFASQIGGLSYKIVHVKHLFDLNGGTVTLPDNCVFVFEGGGLVNGTVVCNATNTLDCYSGAMQMLNLSIILNNAKVYPDYNTLIKDGAVCTGMPAAGTFYMNNGTSMWSDGTNWIGGGTVSSTSESSSDSTSETGSDSNSSDETEGGSEHTIPDPNISPVIPNY